MLGIPPLALSFVALSLAAGLALALWASIDAATRPQEGWERSGQSKTLWIALPIAALVLPPPGLSLAVALAYFGWVRPKVRLAERPAAA